LNNAVQINPANYQAYQILGMIYEQRGDKATAQQYLAQSQRIQQAMQQR